MRLNRVWPDIAPAWLDALPALLDEYATRWKLTLGPPFELSYNYVAPAIRADGSRCVLKAGVPDRERRTEIAALAHYDGNGAIRLLEADADRGVALLERAEPGDMLLTLDDDDERTIIAADTMRTLFRPPPPGVDFPTIASWSLIFGRLRARFDGGTGPFPAPLFERAEAIATDAGDGEQVLLHGDLHHGNILRATRLPWLAIDPKGVAGDPACEAGSLLLNPWTEPLADIVRLIPRRLDILAEYLAIDRERLAAWSLHKAVLSACWTVEDGEGPPGGALAVAEALLPHAG